MTPEDKSILDSLGIYISPHIVNKYHHHHSSKEPHTRFYYFVNRQKTYVPPENVSYDKEVSSTLCYKKNCFYKMSHLSKVDAYFDYYFMLKPDCPKTIVKRKNVSTKAKMPIAGYQKRNGKFVLSFDT
jgi:hypothetical protein